MRYKFDDKSLEVGFIKELLKEFDLPMLPVYRAGEPLYDGRVYIKNKDICKCVNGSLVTINSLIENNWALNTTKNLIINSSVYDSYTHKYLGNYLRYIRDNEGLNLMPLYNCFSNETAKDVQDNLIIDISASEQYDEKSRTLNSASAYLYRLDCTDEKYNFYAVPVKLNQLYTIAIDTTAAIDACLVVKDNETLTKDTAKVSLVRMQHCTFSNPFIYSTKISSSVSTKILPFEENLKLIIKVPKFVKSSITVLEGDYSLCTKTVAGSLLPDVIYSDGTDGQLITNTRLSLLNINDCEQHPFADRLIEYLLHATVDNTSYISENIGRLQKQIYTPELSQWHDSQEDSKKLTFKGVYNILDNNISKRLSRIGKRATNKHIGFVNNSKVKLRLKDKYTDLLPYLDKDQEYYIDSLSKG